MKSLTETEREVFNFIIEYKANHDGNSPSTRQIIDNTIITSTSHVTYILSSLERKERIDLIPGQCRSIQVVGGSWGYENP